MATKAAAPYRYSLRSTIRRTGRDGSRLCVLAGNRASGVHAEMDGAEQTEALIRRNRDLLALAAEARRTAPHGDHW